MSNPYFLVGTIQFPIHDFSYVDKHIGALTVRFVVEDTTLAGDVQPVPPQPYTDDYFVGVAGSMSGTDAFAHFSDTSHKYVESVLVGTINWTGARTVAGQPVFWCCQLEDLKGPALMQFNDLAAKYPGCQVHVVTALAARGQTIQAVLTEAQQLGLAGQNVPRHPPVLCSHCRAVKPQMGARRAGWTKLTEPVAGTKKTTSQWFCGTCVLPAPAPQP